MARLELEHGTGVLLLETGDGLLLESSILIVGQFDNSGLAVAGGEQLASQKHDVEVMDGFAIRESSEGRFKYSRGW